ncbi:MAG: hypothetical protein D6772_12495 [Bacteroidetes bacterium]|nr:MAG: hypothetical protein D6772_12495 [Bacteroidota bacterium]
MRCILMQVARKLRILLDLEVEQEEKLELLDLDSFREKEAILLDQTEPPLSTAETLAAAPPAPAQTDTVEEEDQAEEINEEPTHEPADTTTPEEEEEQEVALTEEKAVPPPSDRDEAVPSIPRQEPLAPLPKTAFDFLQQEPSLSPTAERFARLRSRNLRAHTSDSAAQVRKVAKKSVAEQTELASETLAILLEGQGQYERAIEMYKRLSLLNPEKSRYFAAAIEKLKQKI